MKRTMNLGGQALSEVPPLQEHTGLRELYLHDNQLTGCPTGSATSASCGSSTSVTSR